MSHYKYEILGGGMTAASAVRGIIRELDREVEIGRFPGNIISGGDTPSYKAFRAAVAPWREGSYCAAEAV